MKGKKLKIITGILVIFVICLVSFVGVYKQNMNQMQNQVKGYDLTKDLKGYRELVFTVSDATEVLDTDGNVVGNTDDYSDETIESYSYQKTENKVNSEENLNLENYQKAKTIIENRLKNLGVEDYNIGLDTQNGTIYLQIPENSSTDHTVSNILQVANFEIRDAEDSANIYITNDEIENVAAVYNTTTSGTTVYLEITFNKTGRNILKELSSGDYATKEESSEADSTDESTDTENSTETNSTDQNTANETSTENAVEAEVETENQTEENTSSEEDSSTDEETSSETTEEDTQKEITLAIDSNELITTSFDTPIEDGVIDLSMGQETTDAESITDTLQSTSTIALLVNSGKMPLTYKVSQNNYINTDISEDILQKAIYVIAILVIIAIIGLMIKYKVRGLLAGLAYIGFIALDLLLIRYTNVSISLESLVAAIMILILNYIVTIQLLRIKEPDKEQSKKQYANQFKSIIIRLVPIFIISIIFAFVSGTKIYTFGMFMFWGVLLSVIYNYIVTKNMLD